MKKKLPANAFWVADKSRRVVLKDGGGNAYPDASAAFYVVLEAFCGALGQPLGYAKIDRRDLPLIPDVKAFYPRGVSATLHTATPAQQAALSDLFVQVSNALDQAHKAGVEEGRNLLTGLARGHLTVSQFDGTEKKKDGDGD